MEKIDEVLNILWKFLHCYGRCCGKGCESENDCFYCEYNWDEMDLVWAIQSAYIALKPTTSIPDYDTRERCPTCGQVIWQED